MKQIRFLSLLLFLTAAFFCPQTAQAEMSHAIAMHGTPKYAAEFNHLDYVNPDAPKGGELRLARSGSFDNLNNHVITGNNAEGLEYVNDRLMQRIWDEPFTMYGLVAEKVDVAPDRSWITFYLRKEARFHDGAPMTAEDVKFSYEMLRQHGHPVRRRVYGLVRDVQAVNAHEIKFTFGEGYDRESVLILAMLPVLPKHYWEKHDVSKTTLEPPLGSGPYKITEVEPGRKIVYERVRDYWGRDLPVMKGQYNFDRISYAYFRDDDIALTAFNAGEYDLRREYDITKWKTGYVSEALQDGRIIKEEIAHSRPEWLRALIFNTRRPLFSDVRVRRALGLMFNEEWLNKSLYFGVFHRITSAFPNSELAAPEQTAEILSPRERQRRAIELLKEAGWSYQEQSLVDAQGEPFSFEILLGDPNDEKIALEFSRSLQKIGIKALVRTVDSAQFAGRLEDFDYDMVSFRWINSLSPGNEQLNYWGSAAAKMPGARNYAGVSDPAIDALADSIARTADRAELVTQVQALDRALMQGSYMIPLFYAGNDMVAHAASIRRPGITPVYGIVMESWWHEIPKK